MAGGTLGVTAEKLGAGNGIGTRGAPGCSGGGTLNGVAGVQVSTGAAGLHGMAGIAGTSGSGIIGKYPG